MNYRKQYIKLMRKAENRVLPPNIYVEYHHVFPASIYGENRRLVALTAKEHYVAHLLLWKDFLLRNGPDHMATIKMAQAFRLMQHLNRAKKSRVYELFRKAISLIPNFWKGKKRKPMSEDTKLKISKSISGVNHHQYGKPLSSKQLEGLARSRIDADLTGFIDAGKATRFVKGQVNQNPNRDKIFLTKTGTTITAIHDAIALLVSCEDKLHPLSDAKIKDKLLEFGISVGTETVRRHRIKIGIPQSNLRNPSLRKL